MGLTAASSWALTYKRADFRVERYHFSKARYYTSDADVLFANGTQPLHRHLCVDSCADQVANGVCQDGTSTV